jgi:hypothetical protein
MRILIGEEKPVFGLNLLMIIHRSDKCEGFKPTRTGIKAKSAWL